MRFYRNFCFSLIHLLCFLNLKLEAQPTVTVEISPAYIGGEQQLAADLRRYLVYPENAKKRKLQGTIVVEFDVDSSGKVQNVIIVEGIIPSMDSAAIKVINFLNNWKPGLANGKPVTMKVKLPIEFKEYYGTFPNANNNQIVTDIQKYQSKIAFYLINDSIGQIRDMIDTIPRNLYPNYFEVFSFNDYVLLYLITQEYMLAGNHIKNNVNDYKNKISVEYEDLKQTLDIYLKSKYRMVSNNLDQAMIDKDTKRILKLFLANDSLRRYPEPKNIKTGPNFGWDKTYVAKRSALGYQYLKTTQDTSYNSYVKDYIVAEKRFKPFNMGFGMGYTKIIHNAENSKSYTNPNLMHLSWDFFYKDIYAILGLNIGGSKNNLPVKIDTFNLKPETTLGNNYTQIGLGYRFYPADLLHIIPYVSYNFFDVNYSYEINTNKSINKSKAFETNFSAGFVANIYFAKNNWNNYKPANYFPAGLSFKYALITPKNEFNYTKISHFFSLSFTLLFAGPIHQ